MSASKPTPTGDVDPVALIRFAATHLDPLAQLALEFSVRQGLEGRDLADALGVTPCDSVQLVQDARADVLRIARYLVAARSPQRLCAALRDTIDPNARWSIAEVYDAVDSHSRRCSTCRIVLARTPPVELMGQHAPIEPPAELRDRTIERVSQVMGWAAMETLPTSVPPQVCTRLRPGSDTSADGSEPASRHRGPRPVPARVLDRMGVSHGR